MIITQKELPERHENDEYITPKPFIREVFEYLRQDIIDAYYERYPHELGALQWGGDDTLILDAGAGTGNWGNIFYDEFYGDLPLLRVHGVELQKMPRPENYSWWWDGTDFVEWAVGGKEKQYFMAIGNPPYKYAHEFLNGMFRLVDDDGLIVLLLRNSFMESRKRYNLYYRTPWMRPWKIIQSVRRISFYYDQTGDKSTNATAYSVFVWKVRRNITATKLEWLDWDYED